MASPPFNINQALPGDSDIVSQHPANARTFRDVVESWLLINHSNMGRHIYVQLEDQGSDPTGVADVSVIWGDANSRTWLKKGTGTKEYLQVPVGTILDYAGTTEPEGYLFCYGQAVSRTTYAELFAVISTTYGAGNGTTTFNLPDLRGRVIAGQDDMGGTSANRLTNQTGGLNGDTLGASGGSETHTLTTAQMPVHTHVQTAHDHAAIKYKLRDDISGSGGNSLVSQIVDGDGTLGGSTTVDTEPTTAVNQNTGSGDAHNNVQPTFILNKMIKF